MLAAWTKVLPHFVVVWLIKRNAERMEVVPGYLTANPYRGELFSWKIEDETGTEAPVPRNQN